MDAPTLQRWLDEYVEAWRTYDSQKIGDLFSADAVYRFDPIEKDPLRGRDASLFVMRFDVEDRCREFTEWYMQPKESRTASA
jgi:hypothetical protein